MKKKLTHVDCFSGPGGICTGFHAAGFDTKVAIEFIESCVETYRTNHPEVHVIHSDIRDVTAEQMMQDSNVETLHFPPVLQAFAAVFSASLVDWHTGFLV